ncbi:MAG: ATP-dependent zinc metalloprotease FtsH [Bryobacteraceae bacterium]
MPQKKLSPPDKFQRAFRGYHWVFFLIYIVGAVFLFYLVPRWMAKPTTTRAVSYTKFLGQIDANRLDKVEITPTELIGTAKQDAVKKHKIAQFITASRVPNVSSEPLMKALQDHHVQISGKMGTSPSAWSWIISFLPFLVLIAIFAWGFHRAKQNMGGPLKFGNRAKIYDRSTQARATFEDVAGIDEARAELQEVVDFLKNPGKYRRLGGRIPKGVLLVGAPGTGKTLLARAVAGEAHVPFFSMSGSEFVEMFVGVGAARVRELFEEAKKRSPCIIFIDELDAIGKSRSSGRGMIMSHDEREQTLNQLLVEMDGFDPSTHVIIMAATNTPEVLDPALLRAGRFDRQVVIDRPDIAGREAILSVHAKTIKLAPDVDLRVIAARTPGMVGADLANIINEAALLAARRGASTVANIDLEAAIYRVMLGLEKKSRVMTAEEKERVAYHESGHAVVALSLPNADPVHRVSIIPRTLGALGHMLQLPTQERYLMTLPQLEDQMCVMLGGRASEDLVYNGVISTGATDDLQRATELARQMVKRFGMSKRLGNLTYGHPLESPFLKNRYPMEERDYSDKTAEEIDCEVRRIVDSLYMRVEDILKQHRGGLDRVSEKLIEKETLDESELKRLLNGEPSGKQPKVSQEPAHV